jgi:hypothetical protein
VLAPPLALLLAPNAESAEKPALAAWPNAVLEAPPALAVALVPQATPWGPLAVAPAALLLELTQTNCACAGRIPASATVRIEARLHAAALIVRPADVWYSVDIASAP